MVTKCHSVSRWLVAETIQSIEYFNTKYSKKSHMRNKGVWSAATQFKIYELYNPRGWRNDGILILQRFSRIWSRLQYILVESRGGTGEVSSGSGSMKNFGTGSWSGLYRHKQEITKKNNITSWFRHNISHKTHYVSFILSYAKLSAKK